MFSNIFLGKISILIDKYDRIVNNNKDNLDDNDRSLLWEGVLSKINIILRKEIPSALHIPAFTRKDKVVNTRSFEMPIQLKAATKFVAGIELIHNLISSDREDQPTHNLIANLKDKMLEFLSRAPDDFVQFLSGRDIYAIEALLNADNFEDKILELKLNKFLNCMLDTGLFPEALKANKTVMLFKKGDPSDAHSWRPIAITPTIYQMLMCHISRSLQTLNSNHRFISPSQKGFMRIPAGAAEHASVVDEMIHDAARNHKSLYITTIDFSDAFGSVPHKLIKNNLLNLGFDSSFVKSILNSYNDSYTKIICNHRRTQSIFSRKGVK